MFSILIKDPDGHEQLRGGVTEVRRNKRGVVITWADGTEELHQPPYEDPETTAPEPLLTQFFIMNEAGATVARYEV